MAKFSSTKEAADFLKSKGWLVYLNLVTETCFPPSYIGKEDTIPKDEKEAEEFLKKEHDRVANLWFGEVKGA